MTEPTPTYQTNGLHKPANEVVDHLLNIIDCMTRQLSQTTHALANAIEQRNIALAELEHYRQQDAVARERLEAQIIEMRQQLETQIATIARNMKD